MEAEISLHSVTLLILAICLGMALATFAAVGWMVWDMRKSAKESAKESDRLIRALEALIDPDCEEIRDLMRS